MTVIDAQTLPSPGGRTSAFTPKRARRGPAGRSTGEQHRLRSSQRASVLDQAADRNGSDVAGHRKRLSQGEADIDQR